MDDLAALAAAEQANAMEMLAIGGPKCHGPSARPRIRAAKNAESNNLGGCLHFFFGRSTPFAEEPA